MTKMIAETCKEWKLVMSLPDILGVTDNPAELKHVNHMLHALGDAIVVLRHLPNEQLRLDVLHAFLSICAQAQSEMEGALEELIDMFIWRTEVSGPYEDEQLFGLPLKESLLGCLKTDEERQMIASAYPSLHEPPEDPGSPDLETEEDYGDDLFD